MKKIIKTIINYFKTPTLYNVVLLLHDYEEAPLIVEISILAYNQSSAKQAAENMIKNFNYKHSCFYQLDKIWPLKRQPKLQKNGKVIKHYQVEDITKVGESQNWNHLRSEYNFIQTHYIHKELHNEG